MHGSTSRYRRKIKDLRRLAADRGHPTSAADAGLALYLAESQQLLQLQHHTCPKTEREVGLMLRGLDGRDSVWITRQPNCLLAVLVGSGVTAVGSVDPDCWAVVVPDDLSTIT